MMDYVSKVQGKYAGGYINNTIKVVKSWLAHNGIQLKRRIKITAHMRLQASGMSVRRRRRS